MADTISATPKITRGTTPEITCKVSKDLTGYTCELSIGKGAKKPYFTASNDQMTVTHSVEDGQQVTTLVFKLTQQQTLACKAGDAMVQLRIILGSDAKSSDMAPITILDIIRDGEITDEYDAD